MYNTYYVYIYIHYIYIYIYIYIHIYTSFYIKHLLASISKGHVGDVHVDTMNHSWIQPRLPTLAAIEANLRARQRTAALGALFAVVGLQSMVGLMVTKAGGEPLWQRIHASPSPE